MPIQTKIQVGNKGYLDVLEEVSVPINFNIAEIQDISKRSGNYTKTIKLLGSPSNKTLLGQIFNINVVGGIFNVNKQEEVTIIKNGIPQFNGFMQVLSVTKSSPSSPTQDEIIGFDVQVKDDISDFYSNLADGEIATLNRFVGSSTTLSVANVMKTSAFTMEQGYKYFLPYTLEDKYGLTDFAPAISAPLIWNAIWSEAGYTFEWPTMSATGFHREWIPFNGERPTRNVIPLSFKASFSANSSLYTIGKMPPISSAGAPVNSTGSSWYAYQIASGFDPSAAAIPLVFNDDTTSGATGNLFDNDNQYGISTGTFNSDFNGKCDFKTRYKFEIYLRNPSPTDDIIFEVAGTTDPADYTLTFRADLSGSTFGVIQTAYSKEIYTNTFSNTYLPANVDTLIDSKVIEELSGSLDLTTNTLVRNFFMLDNYQIETANGDWCRIVDDGNVASNMMPIVKVKIIGLPGTGSTPDYNVCYFKNNPSAFIEDGDTYVLSDMIAKGIKRKDFISSIVKRFNLYISQTSKDKVLRVETRDEFYNAGRTLNWTRKLASEKDQVMKFLPDLTAQKFLFTYKIGKDAFSTEYQTKTGEIYGQLEYNFDNDFVKDTKKIDVIFQSVPLNENATGQVVPTIPTATVGPKTELAILYDGGTISAPGGKKWFLTATSAPGTTYSFDKYPYMGHFDNPYTPTLDNNFGENDYLFYDSWQYTTNNNLFNRYYARFINQIEGGKLYTAEFRLNELDILNFNPRDKIYIGDSYFFVNRIIDYDANATEGLTTVELISIDEGTKFTPTRTTTNPRTGIIKIDSGSGGISGS